MSSNLIAKIYSHTKWTWTMLWTLPGLSFLICKTKESEEMMLRPPQVSNSTGISVWFLRDLLRKQCKTVYHQVQCTLQVIHTQFRAERGQFWVSKAFLEEQKLQLGLEGWVRFEGVRVSLYREGRGLLGVSGKVVQGQGGWGVCIGLWGGPEYTLSSGRG